MSALVSILIPAYNAEEWLAGTIRSALAQTWPRREIIVVDDGSRDRTLAIARQFASKRVAVITQENQGASEARNRALSVAQGDYIQWLDADDLLAPDKIERQMVVAERLQDARTLYSGAWGYFLYRTRCAEFTPTALWCDLSPVEWLTRKMALNLHMQTDSWLVSRYLTESAGPWNPRLWRDNDGEYFCRVILASNGIRFVPEARSYYRRSGAGSVGHIGRSNRKLEALFLSMQLHVGYLRSLEDSPRTREACLRYLQTWLSWFYGGRPDIVQQLEQLAAQLGGRLAVPRFSWKYAWIERLFGWRMARQAKLVMPGLRERAERVWDRAWFQLERRRATG
jgi:glycosyltransferase involved in cell wall biosynthesis